MSKEFTHAAVEPIEVGAEDPVFLAVGPIELPQHVVDSEGIGPLYVLCNNCLQIKGGMRSSLLAALSDSDVSGKNLQMLLFNSVTAN